MVTFTQVAFYVLIDRTEARYLRCLIARGIFEYGRLSAFRLALILFFSSIRGWIISFRSFVVELGFWFRVPCFGHAGLVGVGGGEEGCGGGIDRG